MRYTLIVPGLAVISGFWLSLAFSAQDQDTAVAQQTTAPSARIAPRRTDLHTQRRDDAGPLEQWRGSFPVHGGATRMRIGGFVQLDIIHDNDAIGSKGQFIADTIPTDTATAAEGAQGQTRFSVAPSRLYLETRTPVKGQRLKTLLSIDMFGDELSAEAELRLRQAYVQLEGALFGGDLLIGQAWSTTTDLEATPDLLDFRGPDSLFGRLQPQIRWTRSVAGGTNLMLALETPANHIIERAESLTRMPDGLIALTWDSQPVRLMASLLVKDLRASRNNGPVESALGFGGNLSGTVAVPLGDVPDRFMFSVTYGRGIGSHFQNSRADAVYDPVYDRLEAIKLYGVTLAWERNWNRRMSSTFTYCCIEGDNEQAQGNDAVQDTEYTSANLVWDMNAHWLIGFEGIWGKRQDKDDATGSVFRTQLTSRVHF